jgi:pimeloyl-ACP methyl ester carboxylesterase
MVKATATTMNLHKFIAKALLITAIFAVIWIAVGFIFMKRAIVDYQTRIPDSSFNAIAKTRCFNVERFNHLKRRDIVVASKKDGSLLTATLIYNPKPSGTTIIYCHGITTSRWDVLRGGRLDSLLNRGFNILTFDQRAHGQSEGDYPTYGFLEKYDLDQWVDTVAATFPNGTIGVEGISMGAATAVLHAAEVNPDKESTKKVSFYIFDSPYSDLERLLAYRLNKDYNLPNIKLNLLNLPIGDFDIAKVSPVKVAGRIDVPVLFIHGLADDYIPANMTRELYQAVRSKKMMLLIPKVAHAEAIYAHTSYWQSHDRFVYTIVKIGRRKE